MNSDRDRNTKNMLGTISARMGKPKNHSGNDIATPQATIKHKPNNEKTNLLRFNIKMPAANPNGNEITPKTPNAK